MKIVLIVPEYGGHGGGIHTFYRPLVKRWEHLHECSVIIGSGTVAATDEVRTVVNGRHAEIQLGIKRLESWRSRFSRFRQWPELQSHLAASWAMHEIAMEFGPDIVEVCDLGFQFVPWVVESSCPYVIQMHGSSGQICVHDPMLGHELESVGMRLIETALLSEAQCVQCYSSANSLAWESSVGITPTKIMPPLEAGMFSPFAPNQRNYSGSIVDPVFRVLGRLQRWKGAETVASALELMGNDAPTLEWYGRDTSFGHAGWMTSQELRRAYPGVYGCTMQFLGQVSQMSVYDLQAKALCNVIPSLWDTFNFTVAEAMASGRPVICSRGAGASELIEDGVSGLLFDAGSARGLADAMKQILEMHESDRLRMASAGFDVVCERLDPDRIAAERLDGYRAAIASWREPRPMVPSWVSEAVSPETGPPVSPWPALDNLPLKGLLSYTRKRLSRRLLGLRTP